MLPSAQPTTSAPRYSLSRLMTTARALAVYASKRRVTPTRRKTRFRWVASPCRVGFGPTESTSKSFRLLLHPSALPRLGLARGPSLPPPATGYEGSARLMPLCSPTPPGGGLRGRLRPPLPP